MVVWQPTICSSSLKSSLSTVSSREIPTLKENGTEIQASFELPISFNIMSIYSKMSYTAV